MKIIAFRLFGDYAHFSHPETIYSSLTYPVPPKTTIMGFLAAVIGEEGYYKLSDIKYSVKVDSPILKKSLIFNGIKFALSSNMHLKEGYQNSGDKKQFYRELICNPSYVVFLDIGGLDKELQERIVKNLKGHKTAFTPYLGINFCIADFEWIDVKEVNEVKERECEINTLATADEFIFESGNAKAKLSTFKMPCDVEEGRFFKDFQDFVVEINGQFPIKVNNNGNVYKVNDDQVFFV